MNRVRVIASRCKRAVLLLTVVGGLAAMAPSQAAQGEGRSSLVREIPSGGRDGKAQEAQRHLYGALSQTGKRGGAHGSAGNAKPGANDVWFHDADVVLFGDDDRDGYYYGIDLLFDADTIYEEIDVYAVTYLSFEGGPWNEYAVTSDFVLAGATSDDEYVVVTELETGYPSGEYDLLIELYDAFDGSFLAGFGPEDTSALSYLPLEDFQRDAPVIDEVIVVSHGGGHALGLTPLLLAPLARLLRRHRGKRRSATALT